MTLATNPSQAFTAETPRLSADARIALRKAITNHSGWDDYRKANNLSLATMGKDDYFAAARALNIDVCQSPAGTSIATNAAIDEAIAAAPIMNAAPAANGADSAGVAAAIATVEAHKGRTVQEDDDAPEFDPRAIPALPLPLNEATIKKIDDLIALAVDSDVSFRALYLGARLTHHCATSLLAENDRLIEQGTVAKDPHHALVKPSLDFVPPSWSREFLDYLEIGSTIAVVGPSGNGKTTGARKMLERAGFTVYEFDCTDATLPQDLIGRTSLRQDGGATVTEWQAGPIALAFRDPKGAVLLNEYDALDPRTGMALQSALEAADRRRVTAPDTGEQLRSEGPCPIVLTLNTIGHGATVEYQGRNALDGANRDRVELIMTGYENEAEILVAHGATRATADRLADWAVTARARLETIGSREILSNRRLLTASQLIDGRGMALSDAIARAFTGRMAPAERARFVA